jgi:hypothetical protein
MTREQLIEEAIRQLQEAKQANREDTFVYLAANAIAAIKYAIDAPAS